MFKIYPDNLVQKQIVLRKQDSTNEIIFTLLEDFLEISYIDMHTKIPKLSIKNININENKENNCVKIFLNLEKNINIEYICFFSDIDIKKLLSFFKEFVKDKWKIRQL